MPWVSEAVRGSLGDMSETGLSMTLLVFSMNPDWEWAMAVSPVGAR